MKFEVPWTSALEKYHTAQKTGDLETILDMFVYEPQYLSGGVVMVVTTPPNHPRQS